ncbi:tetratricopeptide repeat protein [Candidatus Chloroploca sp. Khr17]|uniref:tetratricopeptide repeat protein n=1 Tax=Candidatus Chloroploca sp. Khr17 TaxID=2496869 RepID=UPI00101C88A0|nr:tetratricopeptide repeat protein [Candidatus Chloroploca sp. Khr17]
MSTRRVSTRSPLLMIIIAVLVLAGLGGGAYWYIAQQQATEAAATATEVAQTSVAQQASLAAQQATSEAETQATATTQALAAARDADLERQYQAGVDYQNAQDFSQARVAFQSVIAISPGYQDTAERLRQINETEADAYYQQGLASYRAAQWADAIEQFDRALTIIPNYKDAATQRAEARRRFNATPTPTLAPTLAPTATPNPDATPTPEPPSASAEETATTDPARSVAFRDDFNATMREEWEPIHSGLAVVDGKLVGSEGLLIYKPSGDNHIITTNVTGKMFAVIFRFTDNEGYAFFCDQGDCEWRKFIKAEPNVRNVYLTSFTSLSSVVSSAALKETKPHTLTIEVRGNNFLALVDGEPFSSILDNTHATGGAGLWAGQPSVFDSFEVELLP